MSLTRRQLLDQFLGAAGARPSPDLVHGRGLEALRGEESAWEGQAGGQPGGRPGGFQFSSTPPGPNAVQINSNENPLGPGKRTMDALYAEFGQANRYPFNSRLKDSDLVAAIARKLSVKAENVTIGNGSGELLRNAVRAFTTPERAVVGGSPTYNSPASTAALIGTPVKAIPLTKDLRLDLDAMAEAARGAGLLFLCNPNNPTATVHSAKAIADVIARVHQASPDTVVLIDEAYHDYVTDPSHATQIPLAVSQPNVLVARTMSKAYGMAGLRLGYAIGRPETVARLARYAMPYNANVLVLAAAIASLGDQKHIDEERARNTAARTFTVDFFTKAGYPPTDSQGNFIFVNLNRTAQDFRDACAKDEILVGRDFRPLERTHSRISIGTMAEMQKAVAVFAKVLGVPAATAARG